MEFYFLTIKLFFLNLALSAMGFSYMQFDVEAATKWAGLVTFAGIATGAILSAVYSIFRGIKIKDLEKKVTECRDDNSQLNLKVASEKAEKVMMKAENERLKLKLKNERKITLSQAAKLSGVDVPHDHYEADEDL